MPPNRKANADVVDSLASLSSVKDIIQPKFVPLTQEVKEEKEQEYLDQQKVLTVKLQPSAASDDDDVVYASHTTDLSHPSQSYWDWPSQDDDNNNNEQKQIDTILQEESVRQTLSILHIEESLKKNVVQLKDDNKVVVSSSNNNNMDVDYWLMPNDEVTIKPTVTGTTTIEMVTATTNNVIIESSQSYWDWPTRTEVEEKQIIIDTIKQDEEVRNLFSIDHIEQTLVQHEIHDDDDDHVVDTTNEEHDSYWDWNNNQVGNHVSDPQHPNNSYWDWPSNTLQETELKTKKIKQILKEEEIRQTLSINTIEKSLLQQQLRTTSQQQQQQQPITTATDSGSYWDW